MTDHSEREHTGPRPWVMAMHWHDLLFAHWPVRPETLRAFIPEPLEIDTFEGDAWLAVVPFRMSGIRPRVLPAMPSLSAFPELNLRTYVRYGGRRGVYFFSLDAHQWLAVRVARRFFGLPYFDARMRCEVGTDGWIDYESSRTHRGVAGAELRTRYRPIGPPTVSAPGSVEHFLTERYCFFTADGAGRVKRADIVHEPWPLQPAEWEVERCEMTALIDRELPNRQPLLHFAGELSVRAGLPRRCRQ